jgi:hypothetical protein
MDNSGISGIGGARLALDYQVGVEKLEQDQTKQAGAAALALIEGAAQLAQATGATVAPETSPQVERPDGVGSHIHVVA